MRAVCEVVDRVVDDVVCAECSDGIHLRGAAHTGDLGAEDLGDLHGEASDAARRADDEHRLSGLHSAVVAHGLEGGESGYGDGGRLVEGEVGGFGCELVRADACVLGERAVADAEHRVARIEAGRVGADGFDRSGEAPARVAVLRPAQTEPRQADGVRQAGHHVPGPAVHAGRMHSDQDLVLSDRGLVDLLESEDLARVPDRTRPGRSPSSSSGSQSKRAARSAGRAVRSSS